MTSMTHYQIRDHYCLIANHPHRHVYDEDRWLLIAIEGSSHLLAAIVNADMKHPLVVRNLLKVEGDDATLAELEAMTKHAATTKGVVVVQIALDFAGPYNDLPYAVQTPLFTVYY